MKNSLILSTTSLNGLFVRNGPNKQDYDFVDTIFPGEAVYSLESPEETLDKLGGTEGWIKVKIERNGVEGYVSAFWMEELQEISPEPPSEGYIESPIGHALRGLHGPADPGKWPWTLDVMNVFKTAKIEAAKILTSGNVDHDIVFALEDAGVKHITARVFMIFSSPMSPEQYYTESADSVRVLYNAGVRYFELMNEPNIISNPEGFGVQWNNGREFAEYYLKVLALFRAEFPFAKFGYPGLSPGHSIAGIRYDSDKFRKESEEAITASDWVGVHAYWGYGVPLETAVERVFNWCSMYPQKMIQVTEFSDPDSSVDKGMKGYEYLVFYGAMKALPKNLGGVYSFVASSSSGFGFETWLGSSIPGIVGSG